MSMTGSCGDHREYLSADLDGEMDPGSDAEGGAALARAQEHLTGCADCERWFAAVTRVNRLARTELADPGPGFSEAALDGLLAQLPSPSTRRVWRQAARVSLALVGVVQVALGALPLLLPHAAGLDPHAAMMHGMDGGGMAGMDGAGTHAGMGGAGMAGSGMSGGDMGGSGGEMMGAGMIHMSHEYAAWSVAVGIGFIVGARWTRHLAGALPVLASFATVLCAVTAVDAISGRVEPARAVSHLLIMVGIALIVAILAADRARPHPSTGARQRSRIPLLGGGNAGDERVDEPRWSADPPRGEGHRPRPAARHDAA
jgi:predicted anti-sigma-YlaC factor YlaD